MAARKYKSRKYYSKTKSSKRVLTRRSLVILFLAVLAVAVLFGVYKGLAYTGSLFFSRNPRFEIKHILISSDGRLTGAQLREYAGVEKGTNLFAVDFDALREQLETVPLVESVNIQRRFPSTLVITVTERVAVAQIRGRSHGIPFLVDRHGVVMPATRSGQALPLIEGLKIDTLRPGSRVDDPGVLQALDILTACEALGLGAQVALESFDLNYPEFITVRVNGETTVRFPRHSARDKLIRMVSVLQLAREQGRRVKTVDLTPDGRNVPVTYY
jgi:cell division protein FtsQ